MSQTERIKQILKEGTSKDEIKRIAVFDFDGTLVDTPTPERGKVEYQQATGEAWPHKGWWGRPESLDFEIFKMPPIASVISDYNREKQTPDTLVVMLTGRIQRLSHEVELILATHRLRFDGYYYNNGGSTLDFKISILEKLLKEHPNVQSVAMWDDRLEHIPAFKAWGTAHPNLDFNITVVEGNHHGPQ
jgi:hypothetical protein